MEPILFREVVILSENQLSNLCNRVITVTDSKSRKPQDFFALHVKSLVLGLIFYGIGAAGDESVKNLLILLKACAKIDKLAFPGYGFGHGATESLTQTFEKFLAGDNLSPRHLFIEGRIFPRDHRHFHSSIFQNVTHLELPCLSPRHTWDWDGLGQLARLTHLSTFSHNTQPVGVDWFLKTVAMFPRQLRVFILWTGEMYSLPSDEVTDLIRGGGVDTRVVLGILSDPEDLEHVVVQPGVLFLDYENFDLRIYTPQNHRPDFWALAEEIVDKRLQRNPGELSSSSSTHKPLTGLLEVDDATVAFA